MGFIVTSRKNISMTAAPERERAPMRFGTE